MFAISTCVPLALASYDSSRPDKLEKDRTQVASWKATQALLKHEWHDGAISLRHAQQMQRISVEALARARAKLAADEAAHANP